MKMPPLWKVTRELKRPFAQIPALPRQIGTFLFGALYYDLFLARKIKTTEGKVARGDRVAIYLIYPQEGLLASHRMALCYLRDNGYAPLVVSNLPLQEQDLAELREISWRVMERPNVGYDFGGYRDGFLSLDGDQIALKRLVFLNDSSWFPLPGASNWLRDAEELDVDYAAAASSMGIPRVKPENFEEIVWELDPMLRNFHYGSYALSVGPKLLGDRRYHRYWRRYPLTKEKNKVVRRGEIGMTRFVLQHDFTHGATYDIHSLPRVLEDLTDQEVNAHTRSLTLLDDQIGRRVWDGMVNRLDATQSPEDRRRFTLLMQALVARVGVSYVLPRFLFEKHKFSFLKKSLVTTNKSDSDTIWAFAQTLKGDAGQIIRDEIAQMRQRKGYDTPTR